MLLARGSAALQAAARGQAALVPVVALSTARTLAERLSAAPGEPSPMRSSPRPTRQRSARPTTPSSVLLPAAEIWATRPAGKAGPPHKTGPGQGGWGKAGGGGGGNGSGAPINGP